MENEKRISSTDLVTGARGFLGKYLLRRLGADSDEDGRRVVTLGLDSRNDISIDLLSAVPCFDRRFSTVYHLAGSCFGSNLEAINVKATENLLRGLDSMPPENIVFISSVEIYGRTEGSDYPEGTIPEPTTPAGITKLKAEELLREWCDARGVNLTILRCPPIVGTGMKGPLRDMVNSIYRGTFNHIAGNEARLSVVHAVDVARSAVEISPIGGTFNLTDGVNPTRHDLAEAFSFRMDHKRIYTISRKRATRLARICDFVPFTKFSTARLKEIDTTLTFCSDKLIERLGWKPNSVTEYLTTHVYDESSL